MACTASLYAAPLCYTLLHDRTYKASLYAVPHMVSAAFFGGGHYVRFGARVRLKKLAPELAPLESGRVCVPRQEQREIVRLLYVATRHQVKALAAVLELEGLE